METINLISQDITKKLKVVTNGGVFLITVKPGLKGKSVIHIEVGTGAYALREDWHISDVAQTDQVATVTVERKKYGKS